MLKRIKKICEGVLPVESIIDATLYTGTPDNVICTLYIFGHPIPASGTTEQEAYNAAKCRALEHLAFLRTALEAKNDFFEKVDFWFSEVFWLLLFACIVAWIVF